MPPNTTPEQSQIQDATLQELDFAGINYAVYNPREDLKPGDRKWKEIEANLLKYGNLGGMTWNKRTGNLVGGHQRVKILKHHGRTRAIFAVVDINEDEEKALNIALNRLGEGAWDKARLSSLLGELRTKNFDLSTLGFARADLAKYLARDAKKHKNNPDATAPSASEEPLTREGDVYDIITATAHHRLICGDARALPVLDTLMQGAKAHMIHMDPPYGVGYRTGDRVKPGKARPMVINDDLERVQLTAMLSDMLKNAGACSIEKAPLYLWHAAGKRRAFYDALDAAGWEDTQELIWAKSLILSRWHYHWSHEPCIYARKHNERPAWHGDRKQTTVFLDTQPDWRKMSKEEAVSHLREIYEESATIQRAARDSAAFLVHPTQKPIVLPSRAIKNSTAEGEIVLDLCGGSGSTAIAAEEENRHARIVELSEAYCDVIVRRFFNTYEEAPQVLRNGQAITVDAFGPEAIAEAHGYKKKRKK